MLHRISANYARVIANAARLPFNSASYGLVILDSSCSTCPSVDTALRELRRLLLAGGSIRPTTCGYDSGSPALDIWNQERDCTGATVRISLTPFGARAEKMPCIKRG